MPPRTALGDDRLTPGATLGVLQATPVAVSPYERLGFEPVGSFEVWCRAGGLHL